MASKAPVPAPPKPPTEAELRQALDEERAKNAKLEAEGRQYLDAAKSEWDRAERATAALRGIRDSAPKAPAEKDPFVRLSEEGLSLDASTQQDLLDRGVRGRVRAEIGSYAKAAEERRLAEQCQLETKMALSFFRRAHPQVVADEERFGGALTQAQIRAGRQNLNLDPSALLDLAFSIYNEGRNTGDQVPYTEGSSMPGGPNVPQPAAGPQPPTIWEKLYGAKDVVDESDTSWSLDSMT